MNVPYSYTERGMYVEGFPFLICNPLNKNSGRTIYLIVSFFQKPLCGVTTGRIENLLASVAGNCYFLQHFSPVFSVSLGTVSSKMAVNFKFVLNRSICFILTMF